MNTIALIFLIVGAGAILEFVGLVAFGYTVWPFITMAVIAGIVLALDKTSVYNIPANFKKIFKKVLYFSLTASFVIWLGDWALEKGKKYSKTQFGAGEQSFSGEQVRLDIVKDLSNVNIGDGKVHHIKVYPDKKVGIKLPVKKYRLTRDPKVDCWFKYPFVAKFMDGPYMMTNSKQEVSAGNNVVVVWADKIGGELDLVFEPPIAKK